MNYLFNHTANLKLESPVCEELWLCCCCFTQLEHHNSRGTVVTNHLETMKPLQTLPSHKFLPFSLLYPCISLSEMIIPITFFEALIMPTILQKVIEFHTHIPLLHLSNWCSVDPDPEMSPYLMGMGCPALLCHCSDCKLHSWVCHPSLQLHEYLQYIFKFNKRTILLSPIACVILYTNSKTYKSIFNKKL